MGELFELLVKVLSGLQVLRISSLLSQFPVLSFSEKMANTSLSKMRQDVILITGKVLDIGSLNNNRVTTTTATARYNPHTDRVTGSSNTSSTDNYYISDLTIGDHKFTNLNIYDRRIWELMEVGDTASIAVYDDNQHSDSNHRNRSYWDEFRTQVSTGFNLGAGGVSDVSVVIFFKTARNDFTHEPRPGSWTQFFFGKLFVSCFVNWLKVFSGLMVLYLILSATLGNISFLSGVIGLLFPVFLLLSFLPVLNMMYKGNEYMEQTKREVFAFIDSLD